LEQEASPIEIGRRDGQGTGEKRIADQRRVEVAPGGDPEHACQSGLPGDGVEEPPENGSDLGAKGSETFFAGDRFKSIDEDHLGRGSGLHGGVE
jgi:hypothetical protein